MSSFEIKIGDSVYCQELVTGQMNSGIFHLKKQGIVTEIYRYDDYLHISDEGPIYLRSAMNRFVSLYGNSSPVAGVTSRTHGAPMTTYKQEVFSNSAIIGSAVWRPHTPVAVAIFDVTGSEELLYNRVMVQRLSRTSFGKFPNNIITEASCKYFNLRFLYSGNQHFHTGVTSDIQPYFEIEFTQPLPLSEYLIHIQCVVEFLSMSSGKLLASSNIRISQSTRNEIDELRRDGSNVEYFDVHYLRSRAQEVDSAQSHSLSALSAYDDTRLSELRSALEKWINRADAWRDANSLMMDSLYFSDRMTGDRIINACRWLEQIPSAKFMNILSESDLEKISDAANMKAAELGIEIQNRLRGAIKRIGTENHRQRFARLTKILRLKFGPKIFPESIIDDLNNAIDYRRRAAHGTLFLSDDRGRKHFFRSLYAMEAFCFLLTFDDLATLEQRESRLAEHEFVRSYQFSL
jgi:ApeA N-terminal domain 1